MYMYIKQSIKDPKTINERKEYVKEALFNIATKTTIFVEKNVITCNIAVTKYQYFQTEKCLQ